MLIELLLLGGGATILWQQIQAKKHPRRCSGSTRSVAAASSLSSLNLGRLLKDIRNVIKADGREQLQLDIDPKRKKFLEQARQQARRHLLWSVAATGLALLGNIYPVFTLVGALAVLYLSRAMFFLIWNDFRRGHYLSVYLLGLVALLGMIATGNLVLAALSGVMGGFFADIVNRMEENSQEQMIRVFSGHPERVWLLRDGMEVEVDFHTIAPGDEVVVNAGEVIPADGRIKTGEGQIDQHLFTGESRPVEKTAGDSVFASTLLLSGRLVVAVEQAGNATVAAKIGKVLNQTQNYKDTLMNRGRKISDSWLPVNLGITAITLPALGSHAALATMFSNFGGTMSATGPLTVLSYLQILSRHSILIKDGRVFETLREVNTIVFDKTGTLTLEQPTVGAIHALAGFDGETVLRYAAAAEYRQPHPIAKAILAKAESEQSELSQPDEAGYEVGYGIKVTVDGQEIRVGSARFVEQTGIEVPDAVHAIQQQAETESYSLIYVVVNKQLAGILEMHPTIRPEAAEVIQAMKQRGMTLYIISGDHEGPTRRMAETLGIDHYFAEVLPENKASLVKQLREEGRFVCFVGDGINDTIALKSAQVSISLKGASSAATDTAQIIFMDGTLNHLESLLQFADEFEETMDKNLTISMVPGTIIIGGVYLLHFGIATGMGIFYLGAFAGLGNVLWPLVKHQEPESATLSDENSRIM
jgi:Cu2+-exporting ATPase